LAGRANRRQITLIGNLVVGDMTSTLVAVSLVFQEGAITPILVDVRHLRQQAGGQVSQGEQPTSPIQRS
jgi:hypothetical protein